MPKLSPQAVLETKYKNEKLNCSIVSPKVLSSLGEGIVIILVDFGFLLSRVKIRG